MENTKTTKTPLPRVNVLDNLRGFSLVSMILYHGMYDLVYLFGVDVPWYRGWPGYIWQQSICWTFILVSGASTHYGKKPLRRGLEVLACGLLLTLGTWLFMPGQVILFGVLHFMGLAMLLAAALRPLLRRIPPAAGLAGAFLLFAFTKGIYFGFLGFLDIPLLRLPAGLYSTPFLFPLGLPGPGFASSDYFPLIPWFFLFLCGYFLWALAKGRFKPKISRPNPLAFLGRHSLIIYMLHQPALYGLLTGLRLLGAL